jgi:hypothetical protein
VRWTKWPTTSPCRGIQIYAFTAKGKFAKSKQAAYRSTACFDSDLM